MSNGIHCPNRNCDHVFAAAAVVGVPIVTCPRCGKRFSVARSPEGAQTVPAVPDSTTSVKTFVQRRYRRSINWGRILALVIFVTGGLVVLAVSWLGLLNGEKSKAARQWFDFPQLNCRYLLPERGWEPDAGDLKSAFKTAALVLRRSSPEAWMALLVQDCRDGTPPENELREEAI